jgi:hypothetical protein
VIVNRDWLVASDWLAAEVVCEVRAGVWVDDGRAYEHDHNARSLRWRFHPDKVVIEVSLRAHCMCPLRSQWIDEPDMSTAPKLLPQHKPSEQDNTPTIAL